MLSTLSFSDAFLITHTDLLLTVDTVILYTMEIPSSRGITTRYEVWALAMETREKSARIDLNMRKSNDELMKSSIRKVKTQIRS
jgi:hypothetical protein